MYQRKKRNKWVAGLLIFLTLTVIFAGSVLVYTEGRHRHLHRLAASVANLPEVSQVIAITETAWDEAYVVARVSLLNGEEQVYFIQDNTVMEQVPAAELLSAGQVMQEVFGTQDIVRYTLGRMQGTVIYELVANTPAGVNYVIADARTGEVLESFVVD